MTTRPQQRDYVRSAASRPSPRRFLVLLALSASILIRLTTATAADALNRTITLNIRAGTPLDVALTSFGRKAHLQVMMASSSVSALKAPRVFGTARAYVFLRSLLADFNLTYTIDGNTIHVLPAPPPGHSGGPRPKGGARADGLAPSRFRNNQRTTHDSGRSPRPYISETPSTTQQDPPADSRESTEGSLAEITVTAEKIRERAIDVPLSMTTLSATSLASLDATDFTDFAGTVPGLDFSTAGSGFTQISIRGVTTGYDVSPTVGIYLDDVPIGSSSTFALGNLFAFDPALFDIRNVEVLRGPQGTLYGASAMGGLIRYTTYAPQPTHLYGSAQVGAADLAGGGTDYTIASSLNLPLKHRTAALGLSGYETHNGGYISNVALDKSNVDAGNTYGGRFDLLLAPSHALKLRLSGFMQDTSRDGEATADYTGTGAMPYGSLGQYRPFPGGEPFNERFRLLALNGSYTAEPFTLTSITGYQTMREHNIWDISSNFASLCGILESFTCSSFAATSNIELHKFTEEARLSSNGHHRLQWLIGGFYTHESASQYEYFTLINSLGQTEPNNLFTYFLPSTYEESAAFGDVTLRLSAHLDLTGGIRYARDRQTFYQLGSGLFGVSKPPTNSTETVRNYLGTLRYHISSGTTTYFRYATGYRPGGPNYVTRSPITGQPNGPAESQPDSLDEYEVGLKSDFYDSRLELDGSAYLINWNNIQISLNSGGFSSIANAHEGATVNGMDVSVHGRPLNALLIAWNLAYTHAYMNGKSVTLGAAQGERLPGSPRLTTSLIADYQFHGRLQAAVGLAYTYISDRLVDFSGNRPANVQPVLPGYSALGVHGGIYLGSTHIQLYVHNVLNRNSEVSVILPQFGNRVSVLQPRTIGVTIESRF